MTTDIKAAQLTGAISNAKCRVIWHNERLFGFTSSGMVINVASDEPVKVRKIIRRWTAKTEKGMITIDEKCWTCGGHLKVAMKSIEGLLSGGARG